MTDEEKYLKPADSEVLPWVIVAFIVFMLFMMAVHSYVSG